MPTHAGAAGSITRRAVTPSPPGTARSPRLRGDFGGAPAGLGTTSSGEIFGGPREAEGAAL